ncbi:hypothetical protein SVAN01_05280 [Stagonosporopsis vannaccii]|nr:hypothetical protein SVAN01_05280 [Stagonosporopsis vannaccii]
MLFLTLFKDVSIVRLYMVTGLAAIAAATTNMTTEPFKISSPPGTDIWRKPPSTNVMNAPTHPDRLPTYELDKFQGVRLTFALPPAAQLRQYDQAGLLLRFTKPGLPDHEEKWIKTGIEFYYGKPYISTVSCDTWADWSIVPMPDFTDNSTRPSATIEARREQDDLGKSLWVYWIVKDSCGKDIERRPLREVNWVFAEEKGWSVGLGAYVARPTLQGGQEELQAEFKDGIQIDVLDHLKI